jgi:hypothetical protein
VFRYRVSDLPAAGVGAFMPIPAVASIAASSAGDVHVYGSPGVIAVDAPDPGAVPPLTARNLGHSDAGKDSARPSEVTPDFILPAIYIADAANMGPSAGPMHLGMARRRFCELPVPAVNPLRLPIVQMSIPPVAGRRAMALPRPLQRFPTRTSGAGNG